MPAQFTAAADVEDTVIDEELNGHVCRIKPDRDSAPIRLFDLQTDLICVYCYDSTGE